MRRLHQLLTTFALTLAALLPACRGADSQGGAAPTPPPEQRHAEAPPVSLHTTPETAMPDPVSAADPKAPTAAVATFGAGCYWCTEAVLERLPGVLDVRSGFMGGRVADPTYDQVCSGTTGHVEVVQVHYDPKTITYAQLLDWFWQLHDPTSMDRQGGDEGEQYRSVIFFHDEAQRQAAEQAKREAQAQFAKPIVTEIRAASAFYEAKQQHQDYYRNNQQQGYCRAVIAPKLQKLEQHGLPKQMPK